MSLTKSKKDKDVAKKDPEDKESSNTEEGMQDVAKKDPEEKRLRKIIFDDNGVVYAN